MNLFFGRLVLCFSFFVVYSILHDVVFKYFYCKRKKKKKIYKKCYFWTCKYYKDCEYNKR